MFMSSGQVLGFLCNPLDILRLALLQRHLTEEKTEADEETVASDGKRA